MKPLAVIATWGFAFVMSMALMLTMASSTVMANSFSGSEPGLINPDSKSDEAVCKFATILSAWRTEALRRGITCDDDGNLLSPSVTAPSPADKRKVKEAQTEIAVPDPAPAPSPVPQIVAPASDSSSALADAFSKGKDETNPIAKLAAGLDGLSLCRLAVTKRGEWRDTSAFSAFVDEAMKRGLGCGVKGDTPARTASSGDGAPSAPDNVDGTTIASQDGKNLPPASPAPDKQDTQDTGVQMAATPGVKSDRSSANQTTNTVPEITILSATSDGPQGKIVGQVTDDAGIAELRVDGRQVVFESDGSFMAQTYVPEGGVSVPVEVVNLLGTMNNLDVRLDRAANTASTAITFERLNPLSRKALSNEDALALIIGVESYTETPVKAAYANSDAQVFADFAVQKLGIPPDRVQTLVDDVADEKGILLTVQDWLHRASRPGKSDIYIFFAGHGLASDDGKQMFLLPHDGSPRLLERTALLRDELFADIAAANPRSVTVFLDTCYSGTTRGTETLIASRPIAIRARAQAVPQGFTVMTAAGGEQTAKPLEEAKHGMFSYFLMKGMEGGADANRDNRITAGELHAYVQQNVMQQSSGSQTPELQGDANRVLVRFQ